MKIDFLRKHDGSPVPDGVYRIQTWVEIENGDVVQQHTTNPEWLPQMKAFSFVEAKWGDE